MSKLLFCCLFLVVFGVSFAQDEPNEPGEPEEEPEQDLVFMVLLSPFEPKNPMCNGILLQQHNVILTHALCAPRSWLSGHANQVTNKKVQLKYLRLFCPRGIMMIESPLTDYYNMATHVTLILNDKNQTTNATEIPIQVYNYESGAMFAPFNTTEYHGLIYTKQVVDVDINENHLGSALVYDGKLVGVMTELHFMDRVPVYTNISAIRDWISSGIKYLNALYDTKGYDLGKRGKIYDIKYCRETFST